MAFGRCKQCGEELPPRARTGPAREYCNGRCRMEAHRDRVSASVTFDGSPAVEFTVPELVTPVPVEDQLARAVIESRTLADGFARIAPDLPPQLGHRARSMSRVLHEALTRFFGPHG